jgi:hypothetical protein
MAPNRFLVIRSSVKMPTISGVHSTMAASRRSSPFAVAQVLTGPGKSGVLRWQRPQLASFSPCKKATGSTEQRWYSPQPHHWKRKAPGSAKTIAFSEPAAAGNQEKLRFPANLCSFSHCSPRSGPDPEASLLPAFSGSCRRFALLRRS